MLDVSIASHVRAAAKRFAGANQGNIAVIFAIALVPIITFMGAAIDYSRAIAHARPCSRRSTRRP
jgi:Flp pilus assembly protein TadG